MKLFDIQWIFSTINLYSIVKLNCNLMMTAIETTLKAKNHFIFYNIHISYTNIKNCFEWINLLFFFLNFDII